MPQKSSVLFGQCGAVGTGEKIRITADVPQRGAEIVGNGMGKSLQLLVGGFESCVKLMQTVLGQR